MSTENERDEAVDDALRAYLAAELDPQLGRARRTFERHLATNAPAPSRRVRSRGWVIGAVGAALAASVLAVWALPGFRPPEPPKLTGVSPTPVPHPSAGWATTATSPSAAVGWQPSGYGITSVTRNGACVVIDDMPARVIERVDVERRQWFDPARRVRIEAVSPQHDVRLIGVDTY
jgi:hypothetical protein